MLYFLIVLAVSDRILISKESVYEETLAIRHLLPKGRDRDFVVVSGFVTFDTYPDSVEIKGSEEADWKTLFYEIHMTVGPYWDVIGQNKGDVCLTATVAGFYHDSPDTADYVGYGINWCSWTVPAVPTVQKRIELIAWLWIKGGTDAMIER